MTSSKVVYGKIITMEKSQPVAEKDIYGNPEMEASRILYAAVNKLILLCMMLTLLKKKQ